MAATVGVLVGVVWTRLASRPVTTGMLLDAMTAGRADTFDEALPWFREQIPLRGRAELEAIVHSRPLLVLVVLSLVACVTAWRTVVPWLVVPAWLGAAGVFVINPAVTVFRYELPMLPALVVAVAVLGDQVAASIRSAPLPEKPETASIQG